MEPLLARIKKLSNNRGQLLIEALVAMGISAIILPALLTALITSTSGKSQQSQRAQAIALLKGEEEVVRNIREKDWSSFAQNGVYHPQRVNNEWTFGAGTDVVDGFTRSITIADVYRDSNGVVVQSGGTLDTSTKKIDLNVSWSQPYNSNVSSVMYVTRFLNNTVNTQTSQADFNSGTKTNTQVVNNSGGEITIAPNTKGKWCSPSFSGTSISLPDGPPVAIYATASSVLANPNDILVATSPTSSNSIKLTYVTVPANVDPPTYTQKGIFTLDPSRYSSPGLVPSGINLDNTFQTNAVKLYKSSSGKTYALVATTKPATEVIAILIDDNNPSNDNTNNGEFQDYVNKIYKYWTFFNTRIYQGNTSSTPNQDRSPYGLGASSLAVFEDRGYLTSGGFLYTFNLANIDSKSTSNGLDMVGCRIQLDGYDCNVATSRIRKYSPGNTGTNFGSEQNWLNACKDGGNTEIYATNDIYPIRVGNNVYVYTAVGGGTNPEFEIVNVSNVPTGSTNPSISSSSCGTIANGASGWKRISSLDFNSKNGTQEAANSVFANPDGTRAYISSNGGIDANNDDDPDSWQFYVLNTSNKNSPSFLSGSPSTGATSGYYYGSLANSQLYPRRSLTVFSGSRALLVGQDGENDSNNAEEYQVLDISNESSPAYCSGIDYSQAFSDLASVVEADNDKFVYMVSKTGANTLKIIQGGPDGTYLDAGTYTSTPINLGAAVALNRLSTGTNTPSNTGISFQVAATSPVGGSCTGANYVYVGPDGTTNTFFPSTGGAIPLSGVSGFQNPAQCVSYKAYLSTTDFNSTPTLLDATINYSP